MDKQRFSSSVATVCTLTLAAAGLSNCTSVEKQSMAQLNSVQTVAPLSQPVSQTALAAPVAGQPPVAVASAAPAAISTDPVLAKTGRLPAATEAAPVVTDPAANVQFANVQPGVEYYVIPGRVVVPTPRPGTKFADATPLAQPDAVTGSPLQQMAEATVAAPVIAQTSTKLSTTQAALSAPATLIMAPAQQVEPVEVASADLTNPGFFVIPEKVAVPQPRPGSELAYAASAPMSAAEAIALQTPDTSSQLQLQPVYSEDEPQERGKPSSKLNDLIFKYATLYGVPEHFVHRVAKRESTYNPKAYRAGNYGLMQIRLNTAKGLGYKGDAKGLFDAETNLKYAVKYLRGAWLVAGGNEDKADKLYIKGFYYEAKNKGLLEETNMK